MATPPKISPSDKPSSRAMDEFYRLVSDVALEGIAIHIHGRIIFTNAATSELFGYSNDDLYHMHVSELFSEATADILQRRINSPRPGTFESYGIRKDGTSFLAEIFTVGAGNTDGEPKGAIVVRDITKRKNVEKALLRSEQDYKSLFEDSRDAIYITSRDGRLLDMNKAGIDLFGYSKEEILKLDIHRLYKDPKDRYRFQLEVETKNAVRDYEVKLLRKDGTIMNCLLSSSVRRSKDGEVIGYQGIIRDITEIKKAHKLKKQKELAEQSAKLKEQFLANMSHEIRTPLNAVFGMTNILQDSELTDQQKKYLEVIKSSTDHLLVLINDILDFTKIEAGKIDFNSNEFNLRDLVDNLCSTIRYKSDTRRLELNYELDERIPDFIIGDSVRLNQILINLLGNAVKFTNKGSVTLKIQVVDQTTKDVTLSFAVIDTGIGIPKDKLNRIFDSFTQGSEDTTREFGGTGLGLAITKELIQLQGGTISVKSKVNEGSTFTFILTFGKGTGIMNEELSGEVVFEDLGKLRVLLAEDNEVNQYVLQETLNKWGRGISVDIAENGKIAVDKLRSRDYDLVIMDVQMPVMDGYDATQQIRKMGDPKGRIPILAMTAYATVGEADKCLAVGMDDYIAKPYDYKKLYYKICQLTGREGKIGVGLNKKKTTLPVETPQEHLTDLSYIQTLSQGDIKMQKNIIKMLIDETPDEINKLKEHYLAKEWDKLGAVAHKFKSSGTFFGNKELEQMIKQVEQNARNQVHLNELISLITRIEKMCDKACEELEKEL